MTTLATVLDTPITWTKSSTDAELKLFLDDLQANILKGHGRHHAAHIFMSFAGMNAQETAEVVRALGESCTSAYEQLRKNKRLPPHLDGGPVRCLFVSASGYTALGATVETPAGEAYRAGMPKRRDTLNDPERGTWDPHWTYAQPDAMFLIADANSHAVDRDMHAVIHYLKASKVTVLAVETGLQQTRDFQPGVPQGVEHFGYVDGRSQPLFLQEDITAEPKGGWDPAFKPSQFIVADPNGRGPLSAGSYFVFRKLEQNARGFNAAEDALGKTLFGPGASQDELDRAGAMVVGRFEDGTPLTLSPTALKAAPPNNFDYSADADAARCPFQAHIRKVNPRGDIERITGTEDAQPGRRPIMARRGITYGALRPHNADRSEFADAGHEPEKEIGLLFMAYMASIENQFEFTQQSWANNDKFVANIGAKTFPQVGIDPIIGQMGATSDPTSRDYTWPATPPKKAGFAQFVTLKGGDYFFAPSLSFLRSVGITV